MDVLLLDKTGTITLGNRQATEFLPARGIALQELADAAQLASLADETPEGRSIVVLAKQFGLRGRSIGEMPQAQFVAFTAQTRMSGIDIENRRIRKGSPDAIREFLGKVLGGNYLPPKPNQYKSKNTQADAHEGIRPTRMHSTADTAAMIRKEGLTPDHAKLYELIFRRAVASQMAPAIYDSTSMIFQVADEKFKASGRVLKFDGFLKVYAELDEEKEKKGEEDRLQLLPPVEVGELVPKSGHVLEEKKTKPPGRFTLGSLVKELERLGIGRPSTYAAITRNIIDRGYVKEEKGKVVPLQPGETLVDYLSEKHPWVIDYALTSRMESFLDLIVENKETWQRFCRGVHGKMGYSNPPARVAGGKPSEAQLKYAHDLATKNNLVIPEEALMTSKTLSLWIEGIVGKKAPKGEKGAQPAPSGMPRE
ncbi:MAG: DNA topoisomerase 1 [Syntrophus sp. PtaB.Bin138]|nr:MAG: DNA topoisomerase 1 [Syntrophus sp. PtaB.Bin138]